MRGREEREGEGYLEKSDFLRTRRRQSLTDTLNCTRG